LFNEKEGLSGVFTGAEFTTDNMRNKQLNLL
jgi:hypothetical protein